MAELVPSNRKVRVRVFVGGVQRNEYYQPDNPRTFHQAQELMVNLGRKMSVEDDLRLTDLDSNSITYEAGDTRKELQLVQV